jgi:hypothetical protein
MATISKPSKSVTYLKEKSNNFDMAIKALSNGAKLVEESNGFAIEYPSGGYFKISKSVYNRLIKQ